MFSLIRIFDLKGLEARRFLIVGEHIVLFDADRIYFADPVIKRKSARAYEYGTHVSCLLMTAREN